MGVLPGWLLRHTITVEPLLGISGNGPVYGPAQTIRCFLAATQTRRSRGEGARVPVDSTTAYLHPRHRGLITVDARVTVAGRRREVLSVRDHDAGGLPAPSHLEVVLS